MFEALRALIGRPSQREERRMATRFWDYSSLAIEWAGRTFEGQMTQAGANGARLWLAGRVHVNALLRVRVDSDGPVSTHLMVRVVWAQEQGGGTLCGTTAVGVRPGSERLMREYARKLLQRYQQGRAKLVA